MTNLRENFYAIELPEGATDPGFTGECLVCKMPDSKPGKYKWLYEADEAMGKIGGEWEVVCTSGEATEAMKSVVQELAVGERWMNYNGDYPVWYHSAKESLRSLLASKGLTGKNYCILKKNVRMADTPSFDKEKFQITITVCDNCQKIDVHSLDGNKPSYQEIIGALEVMKQRYIFDQTVVNIDEYVKWKKKANKKTTNIQKK